MDLIISFLQILRLPLRFLSHPDDTMSKKNDDRKDIVIVGGGIAGVLAAKALSAKLDHTLGGGMRHLDLSQNSMAVVGEDYTTHGVEQHLQHGLGTET